MKNLLKKEFALAMHPTAPVFLMLSAMLLIPNYPYYVVFFYTGLAVFFTCLNGRENHDIAYTVQLPVAKRDVVKARFAFVLILEGAQMVIAVPFALLRQSFPMPGNEVGMDANLSLFAFSFVLLGLFNLIFFSIYYKNVRQVGKAFVASSSAVFLYMAVMEVLTHMIPFLRDQMDTRDPQYLPQKLLVLAAGVLIFALLTWAAYQQSVRSFEAQDL
ncbi:MAG: ABC-2 transporter permease [Acutalibacteraceae bacterium]|jgi:hypothetical protein